MNAHCTFSPVHIRIEGLYGAGKGQALHLDQRRASLVQLQAGPRAAKTIKLRRFWNTPESWRLEGWENKEGEKLEGGGGGQHTRLVDALNLHIIGTIRQDMAAFSSHSHAKCNCLSGRFTKTKILLLTNFHRSIASTHTLMKASRASARLEFNVLSWVLYKKGGGKIVGAKWEYKWIKKWV